MGLGLTLINLKSIQLMDHTDKASNIHHKSLQELGGYYTFNSYYHNVGMSTQIFVHNDEHEHDELHETLNN